jgi:hypothetical protein
MPFFIAIIVHTKCKNQSAQGKYYPNNHFIKKVCDAGATPKIGSQEDKQVNHKKYQGEQECSI